MSESPPFRSRLRVLVRHPGTAGPCDREFRQVFGEDPTHRVAAGGTHVSLRAEGGVRVATDPSGQATVALHGRLADPGDGAAPTSAPALAAAWAERGDAVWPDLHGSFAVVAVDHRSGRVAVVTDRGGSRWVFHSAHEGHHLVTTELRDHPTHHRPLDPVGVAWSLSYGIAVEGRTLFDGVRILAPARVHDLGPAGVQARAYWTYRTGSDDGGRTDRALSDDLLDLLRQAAQTAVADVDRAQVSLSLGWDVPGVVGVLMRELGFHALDTFSYGHGPPHADADPALAAAMARTLGLPHRVVESYRGGLVAHIRRNALWGGGLGNVVDELDAWAALGAEEGQDDTVLLTGDQRFGGRPAPPGAGRDWVVFKAGLRPFELPSTLRDSMPATVYRDMARGTRDERDALVARIDADTDQDLHDVLRFEQRLPWRIMPWRDLYAARVRDVRSPWLDNRVVDFAAGLPPRLRAGKRLYKDTVQRRFPDLFQAPRAARSGYDLDLPAQLAAHSRGVVEQVLAGSSRLDELLPPPVLARAFVLGGGRPAGPAGVRARAGALVLKARERLGGGERMGVHGYARLFRRMAVVREALRIGD